MAHTRSKGLPFLTQAYTDELDSLGPGRLGMELGSSSFNDLEMTGGGY